jgi:hypothetical protein
MIRGPNISILSTVPEKKFAKIPLPSPRQARNKWSQLTIEELLAQYDVNLKEGLSDEEVEKRRAEHGW